MALCHYGFCTFYSTPNGKPKTFSEKPYKKHMKTIYKSNIVTIILLLIVLMCKTTYAQIPSSQEEIDSLVNRMKQHFFRIEDDSLMAFYFRTGDTIQVFNPAEKMSIIIELKSNDDTIIAKAFYAYSQNLIFMNEKHYIFSKNNIVDVVENRYFKLFYHAYYYVLNEFFDGGDMSYGVGFKDYTYSPEPIAYVNKMIKQCRRYLSNE